jgi:hypothetical protein
MTTVSRYRRHPARDGGNVADEINALYVRKPDMFPPVPRFQLAERGQRLGSNIDPLCRDSDSASAGQNDCLFFAGQGWQFARTIWEKNSEQKKNHEGVTQNIQHEKQKQFRDEVVRILPRNPFEESLKESLHQVRSGICQIGNRPVDSGGSQRDREKRDDNSAKNGIPDEFAAQEGIQLKSFSDCKSVR